MKSFRRWLIGAVDYFSQLPVNEVLQVMRITRSDKIEPPGYCIAISHDTEELEFVNQASKASILQVGPSNSH